MKMIMNPTKLDNVFIAWIPAIVLTLWFLASIPVYSQTVGATLSGTITDESHAAIPKATVSILNEATGVATTVTTNADGIYNAPNVLPGNYQATVSADGFQRTIQNGIILTVGAQQVLDITLKVGSVSQTVEVTAQVQDVQLASATIAGEVSSNTIVELPLNGRSWTDLAALEPGVATIHSLVSVSSFDRAGRGLGDELSISGGRPVQNNYLLDGVSINDYTNQGPGSILGGNLGADAVAQFTVLTTNYSTEYGRTSGGVISAITRSGTNQFHGTAYEFLRNSALDARNFFDLPKIPEFRRNQFGASAGAPIRKGKTFIFGDYEGLRQSLGLSTADIVPSLTARQGILVSVPSGPVSSCPAGTTLFVPGQSNICVNNLVIPFLKFYPLPNGSQICPCSPTGAGDAANFNIAGYSLSTENYFTIRVDHRFSNENSLAAIYMFDNATNSTTDEFNNILVLSGTRRQVVALEETHVFSSGLLNTLRFGFNTENAGAPSGGQALNPLAADTTLGFSPGTTAGVITIPGVTDFSGGLSATQPNIWHWHDFQVYDNVFLTKGIHSLKFGANVERIQDNVFESNKSMFAFNSLQDFLTNVPFSMGAAPPNTSKTPGIRETLFGAYVQDDIRIRPNLTINAGLRYEMATVMKEINGRFSTLHCESCAQLFIGNPLYKNPSLRDFEPRVGFSWDPFRTGKTAVRGGFGIFDVQILPTTGVGNAYRGYPFSLSYGNNNLPPGSFPGGAFLLLQAAHKHSATYIEQNPKRNYVMQWNLNLQREIAPNTTVMMAYVGSRGLHNLFRTDSSSIVLPVAKTPLGYLWPIPFTAPLPAGSTTCTDGSTPTPTGCPWPVLNLNNWGGVGQITYSSDSWYEALEFELTRRMGHGLEAKASYTYGKSIDTSSGSTNGDQFLNGISSMYFFDPKFRRGVSDFNVPQSFVASYNWEVPSPKGAAGVLRWASSGWEFGGILTANSGSPFTMEIVPDPLGMNNSDAIDFPNRVPGCNPIHGGVNYLNVNCFSLPMETGPVVGMCSPFGAFNSPPTPIPGTCANLVGNGGRNTLVGPRLINFDMSLFKDNRIKHISETFNAQFRVEVFNIFNHTNLSSPVSSSGCCNTIFDQNGVPIPGAGQITATATTSRQIQFALKLIW
jgi:Carboxypeptidase regulatory-like domain/TonB-dependent Receptor Plug Domain/TonB dependent receptor